MLQFAIVTCPRHIEIATHNHPAKPTGVVNWHIPAGRLINVPCLKD
jgi:hypothetical protein